MKQMLFSIAALIGLFIISIVYISLDAAGDNHIQIDSLTSYNTDSTLNNN